MSATVNDGFDSLWKHVHGDVPMPANQKPECREFFYSGYWLALEELCRATASMPDAEAARFIASRLKECNDYFETEPHGRGADVPGNS